ncbi:MAG TPA: hypothetical protein VMG62_06760 [Solirubrobacteraceae bacterium]|nr:hypothetical protein [Solirubrobacteraceae bacterium]
MLADLRAQVENAVRGHEDWFARLRAGLVAFLGFIEDHPRAGRMLVLRPQLRDGAAALRREQRVQAVLTGLLDDSAPAASCDSTLEPELLAELVAAGVISVVRTCLLEGEQERGRLVALAPELTAFATTPYLGPIAKTSGSERQTVRPAHRAATAHRIRTNHRDGREGE